MTLPSLCIGCTSVILERDGPEALGVSRRQLRELIDDGVLRRMRRRVVVGECLMTRAATDRNLAHRLELNSLLLTRDDVVASHESAALVLGLPVLDLPDHTIGTRERGAWRGGPMSRIRIAPLPSHHRAVVGGVRCTSMARTVIDIARSASFREAVVVGDAALRRGCDAAVLAAVLDECSCWADVGKARRALSFFDGRSESALESVSRAIFHERDLPAPELQVSFVIDRSTTYRADFYWREQRLIGEADGMQKYDRIEVVKAEKVRQERLEQRGLTVVRWNWREIMVDTDATMARLRARLR